MERTYSESSAWIEIQQKTFTNWVNEQLRPVDKKVEDLRTDFEDGLLLIALMEALIASRGLPVYKKKTSYSKNPKLRVQKMENVSHALHMMERAGIKMVNVGNEDIVEGNLKLILGLLWRIIQKFQLSGGGGGGGTQGSFDGNASLTRKSGNTRPPPKKMMLAWVNGVLPEEAGPVKNFSSDWNDGLLLSALINYCDPTLMAHWKEMNRSDKLENCREAMNVANEKLGIPNVLSPEDLSNKHIDELSGMTYISYFLRHEGPGWYATLNWVRKNVPEEDVQNFQSDWNDGIVLCGLVNAVGGDCPDWKDMDREDKTNNCQKGIEAGRKVSVEPLLKASELSHPDVDELNVMAYAAGFHKAKPVSETFKTSFGAETYAAKTPTDWGQCAKIDLSRSSGLDKTPGGDVHGARADEQVTIHVRVLDQQVSVEDISAQIESPGSPVPISLKALSTELVEVQFVPMDQGMHKVSVRCRGEMVRGSPIRLAVEKDMSSYPRNVKVGGTSAAVLLGEELNFQVDAQEAGQGDISVNISNGHVNLPVRITREGRVFTIHTRAKEVGLYVVDIQWNGQSITDDPMKISVQDPSKCRAVGEGLSRAREDTPAMFTVDPTAAGPGQPRVQVEGPNSMAKVSVEENRDGTYTVTYIPVEVGMFTLKIYWADQMIPGSPFHIKVTDPRKVRVVKSSMRSDQIVSGAMKMTKNKEFKIVFDTTEAGPGIMQADLDTPTSRVPLNVESEMQGRQSVTFTPDEEGEHELKVMWSGYPIKGSPIKIFCKTEEVPIDHTKVRVRGEGMEVGKVFKPSEFIIDGAGAGPGVPGVRMSGLHSDIDVTLTQIGASTYRASYIPEKPGTYLLHLTWSDRQVVGSPFKVNIQGDSHAERVKASGGALKMLVSNQTSRLVIDGREAGDGDLTARCMGPSSMAEVHIGDNQDNTYSLLITPKEQGKHVLEVKYGSEHIQGSPFVLRVAGAPDASEVRCFGPGLEHGILSSFRGRFICETKGAGAGQLKVRVHGPKGAFRVEMKRSDTRDRTIDVLYNPSEVGDYTIHVKWSDKHVPGSPFLIKIVDGKEQLREVQNKFPTYSSVSKGTHNGGLENGWAEDI
ncbi:filamin-A-like [Diadema setosum]|uniref:filamin-A-like n=1 Tax=Diadema setosum TaxID=31175 RepID=UPI003B3A0261